MPRTNHVKIAVLENKETRIKIDDKSETDFIIKDINFLKLEKVGGKIR